MSCDTARILIENNDPALAEHVASCPSCIVGARAPYYEAPTDLERKIRQSLRRETATPAYWRWGALAASFLLLASLAGNVLLLRSRTGMQEPIAEAVLSAHVRSLAGTHLLDVPSSDQHTVKPWFNGKLDFSPNVKFLNDFPLLGGRMEYLDGHLAAALIYGRNKHVINLFIWPSPKSATETRSSQNGYHLLTWTGDGMTYWAVSDVNEAELGRFASLYRQGK